MTLLEPRRAPSALTLRPHQDRAVADIIDALATHDRTTLVSACGTGKTITLHAVAERIGAGTIVVFAPALNLVDQLLAAWRRQYGKRMRAVVVCSDDSVGRRRDNHTMVTVGDFAELGATVVKNAASLVDLLVPGTPDAPLVVFSTYQSSAEVAVAQAMTGVVFDLVVADEAHRLAFKDRRAVSARSGILVLEDDQVRARKRVFATATPRTIRLRTDDGITTAENAASMDNESLFGAVGHDLDLRTAIDQGLLCDYRVSIVAVSEERVRRAAGFTEDIELDPTDPRIRMAMSVAALARAKEEYGVRSAIAYLNSQARARDFARITRQLRIMPAHVITGDMTMGQRRPLLERVGRDGGVLANVRCLSEGVDLPSLDAVLFGDSRQSKVDIVQAVGRTIRTAPGKMMGHVILPVLDEPGNDDDQFGTGRGFDEVWQVLAQLAESDSAVRTIIREPRERLTDEVIERSPIQVLTDRAGIDQVTLARRLTRMLIMRTSRLTGAMRADYEESLSLFIQRLRDFHSAHSRWPSRVSEERDEAELGQWLSNQRAKRKEGRLSAAREGMLNRDLPGWESCLEERWQRTLRDLADFYMANGRYPSKATGSERSDLGSWISKQRVDGRAGRLTSEHRRHLDAALPGWNRGADDAWDDQVARLVEVMSNLDGDWPSHKSDDPIERQAAHFLSNQKALLKTGTIPSERREKLNRAVPGWQDRRPKGPPRRTSNPDHPWVQQLEKTWEDTLAALVQSVVEFGRLPSATPGSNDSDLGRWISTQRKEATKGNLPEWRREKLNRLVPDWNRSIDDAWQMQLDKCVSIKSALGGAWPAPHSKSDAEKSSAVWLTRQRKLNRAGELDPSRRMALDSAIPGWNRKNVRRA